MINKYDILLKASRQSEDSKRQQNEFKSLNRLFKRQRGSYISPLVRYGSYKKAPESIFKLMRNAPKGKSVYEAMKYISKEGQKNPVCSRELIDEKGNLIRTKKQLKETYKQWKEDFSSRKNGKDALHLLLSAKTDHKNIDKIKIAAQRTINKYFGLQGYRYVIAVHTNSDNPHAHIILNTTNQITKKKFNFKYQDPKLLLIRKDFSKNLQTLGIETSVSFRKDRANFEKWIIEKKQLYQNKKNQLEANLSKKIQVDIPDNYEFMIAKKFIIGGLNARIKNNKFEKIISTDQFKQAKEKINKEFGPENFKQYKTGAYSIDYLIEQGLEIGKTAKEKKLSWFTLRAEEKVGLIHIAKARNMLELSKQLDNKKITKKAYQEIINFLKKDESIDKLTLGHKKEAGELTKKFGKNILDEDSLDKRSKAEFLEKRLDETLIDTEFVKSHVKNIEIKDQLLDHINSKSEQILKLLKQIKQIPEIKAGFKELDKTYQECKINNNTESLKNFEQQYQKTLKEQGIDNFSDIKTYQALIIEQKELLEAKEQKQLQKGATKDKGLGLS